MDTSSCLHRERVQAAFRLSHAAPAACPLRLAGPRGAGAGPAADAGESLVEERMVGDLVLADVAPDVVARPPRERKHLHHRVPVGPVVFEHFDPRACLTLIATHRADPSVEADERALQGLDLPNPAAAVGIRLVEGAGV